MAITLKINGENKSVEAAEGTPLLWVLRDHLGLTGTSQQLKPPAGRSQTPFAAHGKNWPYRNVAIAKPDRS